MKKKITAIVQARIGSSRLRGKVLKKLREGKYTNSIRKIIPVTFN